MMMPSNRQIKQKRWRKGYLAESMALWLLRLKGYRFVAQRYKTPRGEIDLIVQRNETFIFVEVKARQSYEKGKEAVTVKQRRRIEKAAELFMATQKTTQCSVRFDVVLVMGFKMHHLVDAWRMGD